MPIETEIRGVSGLCLCVKMLAIAATVHSVAASDTTGTPSTSCGEPGRLFLAISTGLHANEQGSVLFTVEGNAGVRDFTFASGSTAPDIAAAMNAFAADTGVRAHSDDCQPYYVYLYSSQVGARQFVSVEQIGGYHGFINKFDGNGYKYSATDQGLDGVTGDLNCNGTVDHVDLMAVIERWQICYSMWCQPQTSPFTCNGDANNDLQVNVADLLTVIANWGQNG